MKRAVKDQWIKDLTSGEYEQCTSRLYNGSGYCCLGVLAHSAGRKVIEDAGMRVVPDGNDLAIKHGPDLSWTNRHALPDQANEALGLPESIVGRLITLNDQDEADFERIAAYIKHRVPVEK